MTNWFIPMERFEIRHLAKDIDGQEFDHVFRITPKGCVDGPERVYAPDVYNDPDGDITIDAMEGDEWTALTGRTGQYGYHGAVMHPSEYIGGNLARDIIEMSAEADEEGSPLLWTVVTVVDSDDDEDDMGWAVLYLKLVNHSDYPHNPGYLPDCPACEAVCHCGPGVADGRETECVWSGHSKD